MTENRGHVEGVYVEILGHKAKIALISSRLADGLYFKEDYLSVHLEFDEAVDGTLGFGFNLPAKAYERDEFLAAVIQKGEKRLGEILEHSREDRERRKSEQRRQSKLDSIVDDIVAKLGPSR